MVSNEDLEYFLFGTHSRREETNDFECKAGHKGPMTVHIENDVAIAVTCPICGWANVKRKEES